MLWWSIQFIQEKNRAKIITLFVFTTDKFETSDILAR